MKLKAVSFTDMKSEEIASNIWFAECHGVDSLQLSAKVAIEKSPDGYVWYVWNKVTPDDDVRYLKVVIVNRLSEKEITSALLGQMWACH